MTELFIRKSLAELKSGDRFYWDDDPCKVVEVKTAQKKGFRLLSIRWEDGTTSTTHLPKDRKFYVRCDVKMEGEGDGDKT